MRNKHVTLAAGFALLLIVPLFAVSPSPARALTAQEIQQQVTALLAQIARLQEQLKSMQAVQSTPVTIGAAQKSCPALFRSLSFGAQGSDVLSLQEFLLAQNLLGTGATKGYFDATTERAVQQLQIRYGVVVSGTPTTTGYGMVGPRTRSLIALNCNMTPSATTGSCPLAQPPTTSCSAGWQANTDSAGCVTSYRCSVSLLPTTPTTGSCTAIALQCPAGTHDEVGLNCSHTCVPNTQQSGSFSAFPASGPVPLEVTFVRQNTSGSYSVDFGDGTVSPFPYNTANPGTFHDRVGYVYRNAGTYYARLLGACTGDSFACSALPNGGRPVLGTATITAGVGSTNAGAFYVSPASGNAPLSVSAVFPTQWQSLISQECGTTQPRYGGRTFTINWGDGTYPNQNGRNSPCAAHTYSSTGTYQVSARIYDFSDVNEYNGSFTRDVWTGSATVTVGGSVSGATLSVSPASGAAPLLVTFALSATDSTESNGIYYTIEFGDGQAGSFTRTANPSLMHTYASVGTYTVRVIRRTGCSSWECSGVTTTVATVTVTVGGGSTNTGTLSASPSSGNAPLAVNFSGSVNSAGYSIDFGDGTTSGDIGCGHGGCSAASVVSAVNVGHTYTSSGTYTAKLRRHFSILEGNCAGADCNVVGTATITVSGLQTSCPVYSPPLCSSTQHLVGGAYNSSTGCYGAPQCVAN